MDKLNRILQIFKVISDNKKTPNLNKQITTKQRISRTPQKTINKAKILNR